jgi:hypothetical protein
MMGELLIGLEDPFTKGSVGIIGEEMYIIIRGKNEILFSNGQRWVGEKSSVSQLVLFDESEVIHQCKLPKNFTNKDFFISFFSPSLVRHIDLKNYKGVYFVRNKKESKEVE